MNKAEQKQIKKLQEEYLLRLAKYESQLEKLGDRNSFSKTDEDAWEFTDEPEIREL